VADQSGYGDRRLSKWVSDELVLALSGKKGLAGVEFSPISPIIRRAVSEGRILPTQVETPPQTPTAAIALAQALGMDAVLQSTIESLVLTEYPKQTKVSMAGELYAVAANYNAQTGEAAATPTAERTLKTVGASRAVMQYTGADGPLVREAVRECVEQVAAAVAGEEGVKAAPRARKTPSWIPIVLVVGLLALVVSAAGDDDNGAPGANAPKPGALRVEGGGIRLTWQAPSPSSLTLLKYQIQRQVDREPWQFIDAGQVGATDTSFFDANVSTTDTHQYRYRIAAVYTSQAVSRFATFDGISFPS